MKKLFFSLLAVAAMASCSKSELTERPVAPAAGDVQILASSNAKGITTRTPFEGAIASDNKLLAQVLVSQKSNDYTTLWNTEDDQMEFDSTDSVGFKTTPCYYPADGSTVYLCGFYPSTGWTKNANNLTYTIDGKTDVMTAKEVSGNKKDAQDDSKFAPKLTFEHLLTQLVVKVEATDSAAYKAWGKITDMYLTNAAGHVGSGVGIKQEVRVTAGTGAVSYRTDDATNDPLTSLPYYGIDKTDGSTTDVEFGKDNTGAAKAVELPVLKDGEEPVAVAYTLVTPVSATGTAITEKHYTMVIKTENHKDAKTIDVTLKTKDASPVNFSTATTGYAFDIVLTFSATEIMATATVTDWKEGGVTDITVQ